MATALEVSSGSGNQKLPHRATVKCFSGWNKYSRLPSSNIGVCNLRTKVALKQSYVLCFWYVQGLSISVHKSLKKSAFTWYLRKEKLGNFFLFLRLKNQQQKNCVLLGNFFSGICLLVSFVCNCCLLLNICS